MQLLQSLALAFWLFGFVQCAFRGELNAATGKTDLERANPNENPDFAFWHKAIPAPKNPMSLTDLYAEASKGFNWLKTQPTALTIAKSAIVAAFYDHRTQKVYMSTIMRGYYFNDNLNKDPGKPIAPLWHQVRGNRKRTDAENGAYIYREQTGPPVSDRTYGNPKTGMPEGSKIVAWGVHKSNAQTLPKVSGEALALCGDCQLLSYKLGVQFDGADMKRYLPPPPPPPDTKKPASAPPNKAEERPGSPPPNSGPNKTPSSAGSYDGSALDKAWTPEQEAKLKQWEQSKGQSPTPNKAEQRPGSPPPNSGPNKTPSSAGSYDGSALDKAWTPEQEAKLKQLEQSKGEKASNKRPASQSPPDAGKHKPQGPTTPTTPSKLAHRPADGKPKPAPRRRSLTRQHRRSPKKLVRRSPKKLVRRSPKKLSRPSLERVAGRSPERVHRNSPRRVDRRSFRQSSRHHSA